MRSIPAYRMYLLTRFIQALLFTMIASYTALYRINIVGLNPLQLVLVGTTLEVITFIIEVPTGVVADVYSRKLSTAIGVVLIGLGFMFESLLPTFIAVLIAQVIWGIGATFVSGAREAWIAGEIGEQEANHAYFKATQLAQVGSIIGILIGIVLANLHVRLPIFVGALGMSLWGLLLFFLMPENRFRTTKPEDRSNWHHLLHTFSSGFKLVKSNQVLLVIIAAGGIYGMFSEGFDRLWTVHLLKNFSFPTLYNFSTATWLGIIQLGLLIVSFLFLGLFRKFINMHSHAAVLKTLIIIVSLLGLVAVGYAATSHFYLAVIFIGFVFTLRESTSPLYNTSINQHAREDVRATVFSIASQANALGQITGGPILGMIATYISLRMGMYATAIALLPVLLLLLFGLKRYRSVSPRA